MYCPFWTYYAPEEVDHAIEHIDVLVERMDYAQLRAEQAALRADGIHRGIGIAAFMFTFAVNGTIVHVVPLLMDRGITAQIAASMMIGVGISTICGRLISG